MQTLDRSAFAGTLLFHLGVVLVLALGTLHLETAGGATGSSTPVAVAAMALVAARVVGACYQRAGDMGLRGVMRGLVTLAGIAFIPLGTLVLLLAPSRPLQAAPASRTLSIARVVLALPLGAALGAGVLGAILAVSQWR